MMTRLSSLPDPRCSSGEFAFEHKLPDHDSHSLGRDDADQVLGETLLGSNPASSSSSDTQSPDGGIVEEPEIMDTRAYQREMLEQSLRHNTIVTMPTGSGKTQVALLRMRQELETCAPGKIAWFLAPTVLLCAQQVDAIKLLMPSVSARLLTGNDNVDTWSASTWSSILDDTRIVVSTPQVLHDALCHAFVSMGKLALLVFDEAHNCVGKAAGSRIMTDFYHPRRYKNQDVPYILGLTASPSMSAKTQEMEKLERILDARCACPAIHRQELLKLAKKPRIYHVDYALPPDPESTPTMASLSRVWYNLSIEEDPYIIHLASDPTDRNRRRLSEAVEKFNTYTQKQMKNLYTRSRQIAGELGMWAADRYLWRSITEYLSQVDSTDAFFDAWSAEEKTYLGNALREVNVVAPPSQPNDISEKASMLIHELLSATDSPVCIVFAKERATVSMLYELLTSCAGVVDRYRIGAVVGSSNYSRRKRNIYELSSNLADLSVLQRFRSGQINLLIATSVLEEGIDVPACNLVICFDELPSFKAFVQRRGRARMRDSKLVLFFSRSARITKQWEAMEADMRQQYEDEEREWQRLLVLEGDEDTSGSVLEVKATGARVGFDEAKQHLEHFCRTLAQGEFVDARPDYIIHRDHTASGDPALSATVLLPPFLPFHVRRADSQQKWKSERNATKDAAFHAYVALHQAGLLNDHLLPFKPHQLPGVEIRPAMAEVDVALNPWKAVAQAWKAGGDVWTYTYTCFDENGTAMGNYHVSVPVDFGQPRPMRIYRDYEVLWELRSTRGQLVSGVDVASLPDHTSALLASHFGHRWQVHGKEHIIRVAVEDGDLSLEHIGSRNFGSVPQEAETQRYLVRDDTGTPWIYQGLIPSKPPAELVQRPFLNYEQAPEDVPYLVLKKWTKRADFLHRLLSGPGQEPKMSSKPYGWVFPATHATVDSVPLAHVQFGMLIPSIIHEMEVMLVAKHLAENLLRPVNFSNIELVREAISAGSAIEPVNYERVELLGDSILKYLVSVLAASTHPEWPEGYLSFCKDRLVSNSRLSRASMEKGLPRYILTRPFTGDKWRPLYVDDILEQRDPSAKDRRLSTKTLADVVEALIGAAYLDGGIDKATVCTSIFIDDQEWSSTAVARQKLFDFQPDSSMRVDILEPLEQLIGYSFSKKSLLLEAVTHASFVSGEHQRSLERLEFLGDAVLDMIIVTRIFASDPPLPHDQMHLLKTAMVNGDFLAFVSMECGRRESEAMANENGEIETRDVMRPLWAFMRHAMMAIGIEQAASAARHVELRGEIRGAMETGTHYPWALLAKLQARKFFSDLVEAILGAVWVDSGSLAECEYLVARLGILPYLDRILRDGVEVQHPKEVLGKFAVTRRVKYEVKMLDRGNGEKEFTCGVHVGSRLITTVDGGVSKDEVKTKAATEAVRIMTAEMAAMETD